MQKGATMPTLTNPEDFVREYTEMWSTFDADRRHELAQKLLSEDATLYIHHPVTASFHGIADIEAHITMVNEKELQGHGLRFDSFYDTVVLNHDTVKFSWQTLNGEDKKVADGMDFMA